LRALKFYNEKRPSHFFERKTVYPKKWKPRKKALNLFHLVKVYV